MTRTFDTPDPLSAVLQPPPNETPAQRWARQQAEAEARRISEQIDDQIKAERLAMRKRKRPIRVLLLGQSESGKSTTVKNFQLAYAYSSFLAERAAWRAVIHLNLIRSVTSMMDVLTKEFAIVFPGNDLTSPLEPEYYDEDEDKDSVIHLSSARDILAESHRQLLLRLEPLRRIQRNLERTLGAASSEEVHGGTGGVAPWASSAKFRPREFAVTSRSGWKSALNRVRGIKGDEGSTYNEKVFMGGWRSPRRSADSRISEANSDWEDVEPDVEHASEVLAACADDIYSLWMDPVVKAVLHRRGIRPEEGPGFFLNDVKRISMWDYQPSDEDVVRARLRTMGVQEHRFVFEKGSEAGREWLIYDVGGARSLRHAWYPYFDNINAIIFLAPISCFDEKLAEDRRVNRLQDSVLLWKAVCSNKLLAKVQLILFLNKCDLLQKKLERGVRVGDYIPTYGKRRNDAPSVAKYFRQQFRDTLTRKSPQQRGFYSYLTSVVDTQATKIQVAAVREGIQRNHLRDADIL